MNLFRWRRCKEEELAAGIQNHFDEAIRDRIECGETPEQARLNAQREFGNVGVWSKKSRARCGAGESSNAWGRT